MNLISPTIAEIHEMVTQRQPLRVYSRTSPAMLMDEGSAIWWRQSPTIGIERADGTQADWSTSLLFEKLDQAPARHPDLDDVVRLTGNYDCSVDLTCRRCDRGGKPIALYDTGGQNPYNRDPEVEFVSSLNALIAVAKRHTAFHASD